MLLTEDQDRFDKEDANNYQLQRFGMMTSRAKDTIAHLAKLHMDALTNHQTAFHGSAKENLAGGDQPKKHVLLRAMSMEEKQPSTPPRSKSPKRGNNLPSSPRGHWWDAQNTWGAKGAQNTWGAKDG